MRAGRTNHRLGWGLVLLTSGLAAGAGASFGIFEAVNGGRDGNPGAAIGLSLGLLVAGPQLITATALLALSGHPQEVPAGRSDFLYLERR